MYLSNLNYTLTNELLHRLLESASGDDSVVSTEIMARAAGGRTHSAGLAVAVMRDAQAVEVCLSKLDGQDFMGRSVRVSKDRFVTPTGP